MNSKAELHQAPLVATTGIHEEQGDRVEVREGRGGAVRGGAVRGGAGRGRAVRGRPERQGR